LINSTFDLPIPGATAAYTTCNPKPNHKKYEKNYLLILCSAAQTIAGGNVVQKAKELLTKSSFQKADPFTESAQRTEALSETIESYTSARLNEIQLKSVVENK
jgi:hypothetical protein